MRNTYLLLPILLACGQAWSQTSVPQATPARAPISASARADVESNVQHIRVEDAGARIDEVRVGGETQSIDVQPKGGMPAYQVAPKTGERTWKVLGF